MKNLPTHKFYTLFSIFSCYFSLGQIYFPSAKWLNKKVSSRYWEGVPENVYYAAGFGGNYIVVIPDKSMVVVTRWIEPSKIGEFIRLVLESHL
jgi:hypothetical protein